MVNREENGGKGGKGRWEGTRVHEGKEEATT